MSQFDESTLDEARRTIEARLLKGRRKQFEMREYVDWFLRRAVAKANALNCALSRAVDMTIPASEHAQ